MKKSVNKRRRRKTISVGSRKIRKKTSLALFTNSLIIPRQNIPLARHVVVVVVVGVLLFVVLVGKVGGWLMLVVDIFVVVVVVVEEAVVLVLLTLL